MNCPGLHIATLGGLWLFVGACWKLILGGLYRPFSPTSQPGIAQFDTSESYREILSFLCWWHKDTDILYELAQMLTGIDSREPRDQGIPGNPGRLYLKI